MGFWVRKAIQQYTEITTQTQHSNCIYRWIAIRTSFPLPICRRLLTIVALGDPSCQRETRVEAGSTHCSPQSLFCWAFSFHTLWWPEPCSHGWLWKILSIDYFREGHFHNQLIHSTDIAVCLQQRPSVIPLVLRLVQLLWQLWSFLTFFSELHEHTILAYLLWAFFHWWTIQGLHWPVGGRKCGF